MLRTASTAVLLLALAVSAGCAARRPLDARPIADDPVCLYNRDLGCVHVRVDPSTPQAVYQGKTYYFCSADCRAEFEKHPAHYLK